jgi:hypothetical protein
MLLPVTAEITNVNHQSWLFVEMAVLQLASNHNLPIYGS